MILSEADDTLLHNLEIHLFGSALTKDDPRDLDILIVYNKRKLSIDDAIRVRHETQRMIQTCSRLPVHVCFLSHDELMTSDFATREHAVKVFPCT